MLTCLCDAFYGEVGIATVRVLEHAGCQVSFPEGQTCCGQPPFNSGDWGVARKIAAHWREVFEISDAVVVTPSSSCAAMIRHGYGLMGVDQQMKVLELSELLIDKLGVERWPLKGSRAGKPRRVAFHRACHGRTLGLRDQQERLLKMVSGVRLVDFEQVEQCCGFGGAFSVTHPSVSSGIGLEKLRAILDAGATEIVSGDMGCLMHLQGLIRRHRLPLQARHFVEILAEALPS
jgi:L-lactate dehydrogenase complex protein LldE